MWATAGVQVAKLLSELDIVRRNIDIMSEIMSENQPGQESPDDYQLLEVRLRVCHQLPTLSLHRSSTGQSTVCRAEWQT